MAYFTVTICTFSSWTSIHWSVCTAPHKIEHLLTCKCCNHVMSSGFWHFSDNHFCILVSINGVLNSEIVFFYSAYGTLNSSCMASLCLHWTLGCKFRSCVGGVVNTCHFNDKTLGLPVSSYSIGLIHSHIVFIKKIKKNPYLGNANDNPLVRICGNPVKLIKKSAF